MADVSESNPFYILPLQGCIPPPRKEGREGEGKERKEGRKARGKSSCEKGIGLILGIFFFTLTIMLESSGSLAHDKILAF